MGWQDAPLVSGGGGWQSAPLVNPEPTPKEEKSVLRQGAETFYAPAETAAAIGTGTVGTAAGGIAGILQGLKNIVSPGMPAADRVRQVQEALTYQPRGTSGQMLTGAVAYPFQKLAEGADVVGGAAADVTGSPAVGAGVNTAIQSIPAALTPLARGLKPAPRTVAPIPRAVAEARSSGYALTPEEAQAGLPSKVLAAVSDEAKLARGISEKNQPIHNQKIVQDLGLPKGTVLDREVLADIRKDAGTKYEEVKTTGTVTADAQYAADLQNVGNAYTTSAESFGHRKANPVDDVIKGLDQKQFNASAAVEEIKLLRNDADKAFRAGDGMLGRAYKDTARALESMLGRHLQDTNPKLLGEFKEARARIAKSYAAEDALNEVTGNIDPRAYARMLKNQEPLSGGALEVARFASGFPRSSQKQSGLPSAGPSVLDTTAALAIGNRPTSFLSALTGRPLVRRMLQSDPYQAMMTTEMMRPSLEGLRLLQSQPGVSLAEIAAGQNQNRLGDLLK